MAVDGDVAVATGSSTYLSGPGGPVEKVYDNCFVMRFDEGTGFTHVLYVDATVDGTTARPSRVERPAKRSYLPPQPGLFDRGEE